MDSRAPRDGRAIEELGFYDPTIKNTDARAVLNNPRLDYWLGVGAQPTEKVKVLIKKYGSNGTRLEQQKAALEQLQASKPTPPPPMKVPPPKKTQETPAEQTEGAAPEAAPAGEGASGGSAAEGGGEASGE
jgi:small subunit ribosomal protein S16